MRWDTIPAPATASPPATGRRRPPLASHAPGAQHALCAHHWWTLAPQDALLSAVLQQQQPFRADDGREVDACLLPDEDGEQFQLALVPRETRSRSEPQPYVDADRRLQRLPDASVAGERIAPWNAPDYLERLAELAADFDMPLRECAQRYGQVTLRSDNHQPGWRFHSALGFTKWR